jgi:uncharacterized protein DUF4350
VSRGGRLALGAAAVVVGVNVALAALDSLGGGTPGGPSSSSYATGSDGAAAYATLLRRAGHTVSALRTAPAEARLDARDTVVLLDSVGVTADDADALHEFVTSGGRLVVGGAPGGWVADVAPGAPEWVSQDPYIGRPVAPLPEAVGVERVSAAGGGSWRREGPALPVVAGPRGALVAVQRVGDGRVVLLADTSPLSNELLADDDNAALGLALAGPAGRNVLFAESYHGYGEASGIDAIPDDWLAALGIGIVAVAVLMLARGRRFGPPEPDARALPPARSVYVDALGALLSRTRDRAAVAEAFRARAARDGAGDTELEVLARRPVNDDDLVASGAAFAHVERSWRRNA